MDEQLSMLIVLDFQVSFEGIVVVTNIVDKYFLCVTKCKKSPSPFRNELLIFIPDPSPGIHFLVGFILTLLKMPTPTKVFLRHGEEHHKFFGRCPEVSFEERPR